MNDEKPDWLPNVREFCHGAGIGVSGWGPDTLVVEANSPDRAKQVSSQLRIFGFEPIEDQEDSEAGLLLLSRSPAATRAKEAAARTEQTQHSAPTVISRLPVIELLVPVIELSGSIWLFWYSATQLTPRSWFLAAVACLSLLFFLRDGTRIWGWGLEILPKGLRVKQRFRWSMIPWDQIRAVESVPAPAWGRNQQAIVLALASDRSERLGVLNQNSSTSCATVCAMKSLNGEINNN